MTHLHGHEDVAHNEAVRLVGVGELHTHTLAWRDEDTLGAAANFDLGTAWRRASGVETALAPTHATPVLDEGLSCEVARVAFAFATVAARAAESFDAMALAVGVV